MRSREGEFRMLLLFCASIVVALVLGACAGVAACEPRAHRLEQENISLRRQLKQAEERSAEQRHEYLDTAKHLSVVARERDDYRGKYRALCAALLEMVRRYVDGPSPARGDETSTGG